MKRLLPIFMAALCALIVSCNKNDSPGGNGNGPSDGPGDIPEEYGDFELAEGAVFMTEDMASMFVSVGDGKIVLSASAPAESVPSAGTVIIAPITEKTPSGLLVKVVSVDETASGYTLTTEPVSLAEAFDELHVDTVMDISPYLLHSIDNEGNITKPEVMTPKEWEEIVQESGETKADASVSSEFTPVSFPFEAGEFNGNLYMKLAVNAKIDISRALKVNSFEIDVTRTTGVGGGWDINKEGEWEKTYFEKELVFRPIPVSGTPLVLVPKLYAEVGAQAEGAAKFKADVNLIFERQTYSVSSTGGGTPTYTCTNDPKMNEECFQFHHLTFEGQFALSVASGGKICLYDEAILAVGGELGGKAVVSASAGVSMEDEGLLVQNPEVALNLGLGASVYAESALFKLLPDNDEGRLSKDFELPLASLEMHALPAYSDLERTSSETDRSISGKFEKYSMIICEEKGFALFEEGNDTPLQHIAISKGHESGKASNAGTKAVELPKEEGSASFSITDSDKMYETKPYAKAFGIYFYGEGESIWVDLGLPSGILWAKYNVGATSPEEYGGYYAWGETEEKDSYTWENYKYGEKIWSEAENDWVWHVTGLPYTICNTPFDVAHVKWGNGARMPSLEDIDELIDYCKCESGYLYKVAGSFVIGPNGNKIFLPFAGAKERNSLGQNGIEGYYRCGTVNEEYIDESLVYTLCTRSSIIRKGKGGGTTYGLPVRPVKDKDSMEE